MSQLEQLKSIYKQFFNIAKEIKSLVEKDEFNEALSMLQHKDNLIDKFLVIRNNVEFNAEETNELKIIEAQLREKELENINMLRKLQSKVKEELRKTNNSLKVNSAYSQADENNGSILDLSE